MSEIAFSESTTEPWGKLDVITGYLIIIDVFFAFPIAVGVVFGWGFSAVIWIMMVTAFLFMFMSASCSMQVR